MKDGPEAEARFVVDPQHPALEGHFPGNPLLPGVVVLDRVISAAEAWLDEGRHVRGLPQVKFLSPLRPGDEAIIRLVQREGRVHFTVACNDMTIAQGILSQAEPVDSP